MTVEELLLDLARRGIQVWAEGDNLNVRVPKGTLSAALRTALTERKPEILWHLSHGHANGTEVLEYPLSYGQRTFWFYYQMAPTSAAYNVMHAAWIRSDLDIARLRRACQMLVDRHAPLRTTYAIRDGEPVQRVHAHQAISFEVTDAAAWDWDTLDARLQELADRPFDLEQGPVLRVHLFTRAPHEHLLLLTVHHIAVDFWSLGMINDELAVLYENDRSPVRAHAPLPPPALEYKDFVLWQAECLTGPEGERLWEYWRKRLAGELPVLNLPTDRPRPAVQSFRGAAKRFELGDELTGRLRAFARAEAVTPYMVVLAALQVLLGRYTGQDDISIGSPAAGRSQAEHESIFGTFVNPVVLRADLSGNPTVRTFLGQVRQTLLEALEHQDYPFPLLVERLQPPRDPSRSPLFQVALIWEKPRLGQDQAGSSPGRGDRRGWSDREGLVLEPFASEQRGAPFDLTLIVFDVGRSLEATLQYNVDLFDAGTMDRLVGHFQTVLEGMVSDPGCPISCLTLLTEAGRRQLLVEWNATTLDYPRASCLPGLFEAQVERSPDALALVHGDNHLTYRELNAWANQFAHHLRDLGVGPETLVGICLERSPALVAGVLGILKAGGAYVPLDPAYPGKRLAFVLEDAGARLLLTRRRLVAELPEHGARLICLDAEQEAIEREPTGNVVSGVEAGNLAYVLYTSGSTGQPKGVAVEHRSVVALLRWAEDVFGPEERAGVLASTSLCFDLSVFELFVPLCLGGAVILVEDTLHLVVCPAVSEVTLVNTVPSAAYELVRVNGIPGSVHTVNLAGEPLPNALAQRIYHQETVRHVFNLYGPTEATVYSTFALVQKGEDTPTPIGRPIANTRAYVLDPHRQPVPVGIPGELYVGGDGLARGYWNRPGLTAERFLPDPFRADPGARMYRTGDLVRWRPDGDLEFLGRIDQQVKIRGFRIELGEIEGVLGRHPAVRQVAALVHEDRHNERCLVAYVVPHDGHVPEEEELRSFLRRELPAAMVPATFVVLEALPLTPSGKVDRSALPAPGPSRPELSASYVAPRNAVEERLAAIWSEVLGVSRVGVDDNFFTLGGASLRCLQIVTRANEAGLPLTPELLFEHQTIAELAARCGSVPAEGRSQDPVRTEDEVECHTPPPWTSSHDGSDPHADRKPRRLPPSAERLDQRGREPLPNPDQVPPGTVDRDPDTADGR